MVFQPNLDPAAEQPLYRQLSGYFGSLIQSGELPTGARLPATRELAGQLGVNRTTVSAAYEILETEGLISGQVGRGSFVAALPRSRKLDWDSILTRPFPGAVPGSAGSPSRVPVAINFSASRPPEDLFPLDDFRRTCDDVLAEVPLNSILQLGSPSGYEPLRQYLLNQSRQEGVLGREDDLLITSGCQQALDLLRRVLVRPGMRVAVEDPVYPGLKNVLAEGGAEIHGLPVGSSGLDPAALRQSHASVCVLTPNYQNPTGVSLTLEDREAVLAAAGENGTLLIESDIYSALRYEGAALPSLKQMAAESGTILLRSFSKIAFPGLRLGWVIGPRPLIASLREAKQLTDLHSDQFSQAIMLRFAESGRLAAHQARMVEAGRARLNAALEAAARFLPEGSRWTRPRGGLNFWVTLPRELDAASFLDRAQREGITYLPGSVFSVTRSHRRSLRLSFGSLRPEQINKGIGILGTLFENEREALQQAEREPVPAMV